VPILHKLSFSDRKSLHRSLSRATSLLFGLVFFARRVFLGFHLRVSITAEVRRCLIDRALQRVDAHEARKEAHDPAAVGQQLVRLAGALFVEQLLKGVLECRPVSRDRLH